MVVKFFPNEAANLEPVVDMLLTLEEQVVVLSPFHAMILQMYVRLLVGVASCDAVPQTGL